MSRLRHLASLALLAGGLIAPATALALASSGGGDGPGERATECAHARPVSLGAGNECQEGEDAGKPSSGSGEETPEPQSGGEPPGLGGAQGAQPPTAEAPTGEAPAGETGPPTAADGPEGAGEAQPPSQASAMAPQPSQPPGQPSLVPGPERRSGGTPGPSDPASPARPGKSIRARGGHAPGRSGEPRHRSSGRARATKPVSLSPAATRHTGGTLAPLRPDARPARLETGLSDNPAASLAAGLLEPAPSIAVPVGLSLEGSAPPAFLVAIYKQAAHRYDVPWRVLAAINSIETDYGRDLSVSSAGAQGWMQFMPSTWAVYGQEGNPYDPHDAIFAAARLLRAAGAAHDLRRAIFAYNHADWYVAAVLWRASTIDVRAHAAKGRSHRYALPLDGRYMDRLGRTDDGVDIETAPNGAAVYSIASGIVVAVASDPGGFGPDYPVVLTTSGPLAGRYIYYGHVAASLVRTGQPVSAGQPIAVVGHTGDASSLGHGHIEIGFCDSSGDPLNHHGAAEAWTPSGEVMRSVLVSLSAYRGIESR
jgi:murein DD-endopeptidase MepM/ murein hydrolase activator NlpD